MAFQFVPNADGGFTEGDKQTNSETGQEYIFSDGAWRALGTEVGGDLDSLDERYVKKDGDTMTSSLKFNRGKQASNQFSITPNSGSPNVNIYTLLNGQMRFRTTHTDLESDNVGSHIILDPKNGVPETKIYKVINPTQPDMAANKAYVDSVSSGKTFPPGIHFRYTATEGVQQDTGLFSYFDDNGTIKMLLNNVGRDVHWNRNGPTGTVSYDPLNINNGIRFTIYMLESSGSWRIVRDGTLKKSEWYSAYVEFEVNSQRTNGSFSTSQDYYVTIAGIC